jgi:hypothetical protein
LFLNFYFDGFSFGNTESFFIFFIEGLAEWVIGLFEVVGLVLEAVATCEIVVTSIFGLVGAAVVSVLLLFFVFLFIGFIVKQMVKFVLLAGFGGREIVGKDGDVAVQRVVGGGIPALLYL